MVSLGLSWRGKVSLRFAPSGAKINAADYIEIVENAYFQDCNRLYGFPPTCVSQQHGAISHTANATQAFLASKFRKFWPENDWPPNSPDLGPLDYFACGYLQAEVTKRRPACLDTLKLAIAQAVEEMPLDMAQRAIDSFPKRVELRIQKEGVRIQGHATGRSARVDGPPSAGPFARR